MIEGEKELSKSLEHQVNRYKQNFEQAQQRIVKLEAQYAELQNNGEIIKDQVIKTTEENHCLSQQLKSL